MQLQSPAEGDTTAPVLPLVSMLAAVPPPIWPTVTHLIVGDDSRLQQSVQSAEISKCISKAVQLANLNIFFIDAFPSLQVQNQWLSQSLVTVLQDQAQTDLVVREVNLRAQQDNQYMSALISMVRHQTSSPLLSTRLLSLTR